MHRGKTEGSECAECAFGVRGVRVRSAAIGGIGVPQSAAIGVPKSEVRRDFTGKQKPCQFGYRRDAVTGQIGHIGHIVLLWACVQ